MNKNTKGWNKYFIRAGVIRVTFCTSVKVTFLKTTFRSKIKLTLNKTTQVKSKTFKSTQSRVKELGLERIHQVTNTIRIANTGWRIRICIREYSDSLYSLMHSINGMRE